ncbi:MAG: hypothetical protein LBS62_02590 [Clostridiales bacterium]|jgi:hypothetical protein|nr:hypothetical protein [Clostridiales bacterium]
MNGSKKYKDSLIRALFNNVQRVIMLYNALTGCAYGLDAHVELLELDKMLFDERRTDIAFLLKGLV